MPEESTWLISKMDLLLTKKCLLQMVEIGDANN